MFNKNKFLDTMLCLTIKKNPTLDLSNIDLENLKNDSDFFNETMAYIYINNDFNKEYKEKIVEDLIEAKIIKNEVFLFYKVLKKISFNDQVKLYQEIVRTTKIAYNSDNNSFSLNFDKKYLTHVEFSEQLSYVLGFEKNIFTEEKKVSKFAVDLHGGVSSFFIYAQGLIEPIIVGDVIAPVLRVVNVKGNPHTYIEENYIAVQYHKVLVKEITEINIDIRTPTGYLIPFNYGNCVLTLHFKKQPYF